MPRAEWHKAHDFAEYAEALGLTTESIFVVHNPSKDHVLVLYTDPPDGKLLYSVILARGVDGILFRNTEPRSHPGMLEEIRARADDEIGETLRRKLGPPPGEEPDEPS